MKKDGKIMVLPIVFTKLAKIFKEHGYSLYMVGGTSRDYLLGNEIKDFDFATDSTPSQMKDFLKIKDDFVSFGSVHLNFEGEKVDITTLRVEGEYKDYRHPESVTFVNEIKLDAKRRDFTINAIYIDSNGKVYDYYHGVDDLDNHLISMIGKASTRLQEDPLRILRALRFSMIYNFSITPSLIKEIDNNMYLLKKLNYSKCLEEFEKMKSFSYEKTMWILKIHHVDDFIPLEYVEQDRLNAIDMHCDTITRKEVQTNGLYKNNLHISLKKLNEGQYMLQTFAIFLKIVDYPSPFEEFKKYVEIFKKEMEENKSIISQVYTYQDIINNKANRKMSALLSVEDGGMIEGDLNKLEYLYSQGVRMMTLTWNYPNEIGYPNFSLNDKESSLNKKPNTKDGLTPFGIEVVKKMNELGMIIDVSHLSDKGFFDCIKYSSKPIVASHSNSRSVCGVVRNLTDEMILALKENRGIMGINYCPSFISDSQVNQIPDIIKHINHIKEVGGIDIIALGSDFDGIPTPLGMSDCTKTLALKEALVKEGYTKEEINKIFYLNFLRVFKEVCK